MSAGRRLIAIDYGLGPAPLKGAGDVCPACAISTPPVGSPADDDDLAIGDGVDFVAARWHCQGINFLGGRQA